MVAGGIQSFGPNGLWLAGWLRNGQTFFCQSRADKCSKFQKDVLIHDWVGAKRIKNCCRKLAQGAQIHQNVQLESIC